MLCGFEGDYRAARCGTSNATDFPVLCREQGRLQTWEPVLSLNWTCPTERTNKQTSDTEGTFFLEVAERNVISMVCLDSFYFETAKC